MKQVIIAVVMSAFSSVALAADITPNLNVGDTFTYINGKGKTSVEKFLRATAEGLYEFQVGNRKFLMTANMSTATTPSGKTVDPHNGQLMLDSKKAPGKTQVGVKWRHKYAVISVRGTLKKDRSCEVIAYGKKKVKAGSFLAYNVTCIIKTVGKKGKRYSNTWYDADTLRTLWLAVGNKAKLGKASRELVKLERGIS